MKNKLVILTGGLLFALIAAWPSVGAPSLTNFSDHVHVQTTGGTATPALRVNQLGAGKLAEFVDGGTPVWSLNNGGGIAQSGAIDTESNVVLADYLVIEAQTAISVTDGGVITPTGSYQPLESAGAVTATLAACGTAGRVYYFVNTVAQTIIISDTGNTIMSGNTSLGQYDALTMLCDGTRLIQVAPESDN